jgi:hypothetical protein
MEYFSPAMEYFSPAMEYFSPTMENERIPWLIFNTSAAPKSPQLLYHQRIYPKEHAHPHLKNPSQMKFRGASGQP